MTEYEGVPIRRLPDGPEEITNRTRWTRRWMYGDPKEAEERDKEIAKNRKRLAKKWEKIRSRRAKGIEGGSFQVMLPPEENQ